MKKKIGFLATTLMALCLCAHPTSEGMISEGTEDLENKTEKKFVRAAQEGESTYSNSKIYIQYGKNTAGEYCLRFATAVSGDVSSIQYTRTMQKDGATDVKEKDVQTLYKGVQSEDNVFYYNGTDLTTNKEESGDYYWACYVIRFQDETHYASDITMAVSINGVEKETRTTSLQALLDEPYQSSEWDIARSPDGKNTIYRFDQAPNIIAQGNHEVQGNLLVQSSAVAYENYDISMNAFGTSGWPNQYRQAIGLVPWFKDANNYIVFYAEWATDERPNGMREWQITGRINGNEIGYNDIWADNSAYASVLTPTNVEKNYSIKVRKNGVNLQFDCYFDNLSIVSKTFQTGSSTSTGETKVGIYTWGDDTITLKDFTCEEVIIDASKHEYVYAKHNTGTYVTNADDSMTLTHNNDEYQQNLLLTSDPLVSSSQNYTITTTITGTESYPVTKEFHMGIVPWYIDDNNFITCYLQWWSNDNTEKLREIQINGRINGQDIGWHDFWNDDTSIHPSVAIELSVKREGSKFSPYINGKPIGYWISDGNYSYSLDVASFSPDFTVTPKVGYYVNHTTATVTDLIIR